MLNLGARAKIGKELLSLLYSNIIIDTNFAAKKLGLTYPRANRLINDFCKVGILAELNKAKMRNKKYFFKDYVLLFMD